MAGKLQDEIGKKNPFGSAEQEVFLNLQRTADALMRGFAELLKPAGLSPTQYNALRILRGAGSRGDGMQGLPCQEIAARMVTKDPDITRLLDRLETRGLTRRQRSATDRRVILAEITQEGLDMLAKLDTPVAELHVRQLAHLGPERLATLIDLLEAAREHAG